MSHVLLLLSPRYPFSRSLARAIELARKNNASLVAVAVIPDSQVAALATTLSDVGFVGEKLSGDVVDHVRAELEGLAEEQLRSVHQQATAAGIPVVTHVVAAELFEAAEQMISRYAVQTVVVAIPARPWFEKLWGRGRTLDWVEELGCPVETVEEERS